MSDAKGSETCWSLVARAARGETKARSTFCRTYLPLLREVDDAVQETFVECLRPDGPLTRADEQRGDLRGFLFGIVRNVALRFEERACSARAETASSRLGEIASDEDQLSKLFDREWARTLMREAGELMRARADTEGARLRVELLNLRFGRNLPIREIAAQWEMEPDAVHRSYARAREEFHACLRQVVTFHAVRTEAELDDECRRLFQMLE